ncbi:HpcH/HpaI aldolase/citrate lyase family protein [Chloroflexota bacterium]
MKKNRIKDKIQQGKLALGTYVNLADPTMVEIIGIAGFDAAFIDMEHSAFDLGLVQEMIRVCDITGITSLVRVPDNNPKTILRVLDMGAQGIQVPHINDKDDAIEAVKAVRYAPSGERGMAGTSRAIQYGNIPLKEHIATSNSEIVLAVMVEDKEAIGELEEIASVDGVDLIAIGPGDLGQALGVTDNQDPLLRKTIEEIALNLKKWGKARMTFPLMNAAFPLGIDELQKLGVAYTNCGPPDVRRLLNSYREQIREIQKQLK